MILPPPRSTLFPHTTLFRSLRTLHRLHGAGVVHRDLKPGNVAFDEHGRPVVLDLGLAAADEDRKSTRLNSSHSSISYAVFCLKKKKRANSTLHRLLHERAAR